MSAPVVNCQSKNCPKGHPPSRLECPTCHKLGIKGSFYCGQECFKAEWKTHKLIHDLVRPAASDSNTYPDGTYNPFATFSFTGDMRPRYPLSPKRPIPDHIKRPDHADNSQGIPYGEMKTAGAPPRILSPEEIEGMRVVCKLTREVLDIAAAAIKPGVTTDYIDEIVHNACIERDAYPSPLNYRQFPKSVCTSINEVICHGIPDQRKLQEGDIINIDVSLYHNGFHGDLNETYPVGRIDEDSKRLLRATRHSLDEAIKMCKPGALIRDIGKTIEPIARAAGCSVVRNYTGHGINDLFHTAPNIPHYAKNRAVGTMKAGMCFTIEPMINLGHWDLIHWPDDWTATTSDGQRSAQFEDTLLITETGVEILTSGARRADLYDD